MMRLRKVRTIVLAASGLDEVIERHTVDEGVKAILVKDQHLLEAALGSDTRILSLDATARFHFAELAGKVDFLKKIHWVNPERDDDVFRWLEDGAPDDKKKRL